MDPYSHLPPLDGSRLPEFLPPITQPVGPQSSDHSSCLDHCWTLGPGFLRSFLARPAVVLTSRNQIMFSSAQNPTLAPTAEKGLLQNTHREASRWFTLCQSRELESLSSSFCFPMFPNNIRSHRPMSLHLLVFQKYLKVYMAAPSSLLLVPGGLEVRSVAICHFSIASPHHELSELSLLLEMGSSTSSNLTRLQSQFQKPQN